MGGHQAGEIASMTAGQTLQTTFTNFAKGVLDDPRLALERTIPYSADLLVKSIRLANRAVAMQAASNSALSGMGTTIVAVGFEADVMAIAHVGDSRAYRLNQKELEPLTRDHSWVAEIQRTQNLTDAEANQLVGRNVITRALGVKDCVEVDLRIVKVKPGDIYILCSDGLCGFADDDEIFLVASRSRDDLDRLAGNLVQMANDRGGSDNVSIIVIEVIEAAQSPLPETSAMTFPIETDIQKNAEDEWLARFLAREQASAEQSPPAIPPPPPSKKALFAIMAVFAIVAVIIVYMATQK